MKNININRQGTQQTPYKVNQRDPLVQIIIKLSKAKHKEKILKAEREVNHQCKGYLTRLSADFSSETLEARNQWADIFKVPKVKKKVNQGSYIWQNCPSKLTEKVRHSQINQS